MCVFRPPIGRRRVCNPNRKPVPAVLPSLRFENCQPRVTEAPQSVPRVEKPRYPWRSHKRLGAPDAAGDLGERKRQLLITDSLRWIDAGGS